MEKQYKQILLSSKEMVKVSVFSRDTKNCWVVRTEYVLFWGMENPGYILKVIKRGILSLFQALKEKVAMTETNLLVQ